MKTTFGALFLLLLLAALIVLKASLYTLKETEQAIITQFGEPVGDPVTQAGLHFKTPFIQDVNRLDKRVLEWDGAVNEIPTQDKLFIIVDTYARWRIREPLTFFLNLRDETIAQTRIDDILDGATRNAIGKYALIEIVRTATAGREAAQGSLAEAAAELRTVLPPISIGREAIMKEIHTNAAASLAELGIELLDIRFKRINYNEVVEQRIYDRMVSERKQMADKFRSEGQGEAARIIGEKERDLKQIESEAYKQIQTIRGQADARATDIYARAYNQSPQAYDFYQFMKTMETFQTTLDLSTTVILSTDGDFFKYLKGPTPATVAQ
jgi:membrane protease subunit HflC